MVGCQTSSSAPTATHTPPVLVRRLATVGPTQTPNPQERQATQLAALITPTVIRPTTIPTPTPYIGIFLGEADISDINRPLTELDLLPPTAEISQTIPIICAIAPDPVFGTNWQAESRVLNGLRCPIQERFGFTGRTQLFQSGVMYWRTDTNEVWAIRSSTPINIGQWWYEDEPPPLTPQGQVPPEGLQLPQGIAFGVWAGIPDVLENLEYATTADESADINIQRYEGGTLFLDVSAGQVFALLNNGNAYGPIEQGVNAASAQEEG